MDRLQSAMEDHLSKSKPQEQRTGNRVIANMKNLQSTIRQNPRTSHKLIDAFETIQLPPQERHLRSTLTLFTVNKLIQAVEFYRPEQLAKMEEEIHQAFITLSEFLFDLDSSYPPHQVTISHWWSAVMDLYLFDKQLINLAQGTLLND